MGYNKSDVSVFVHVDCAAKLLHILLTLKIISFDHYNHLGPYDFSYRMYHVLISKLEIK